MTDHEDTPFGPRIHPEGAPGTMQAMMRQFMGDAAYEQTVAQRQEAAALERQANGLAIARYKIVTSLVTLALLGVLAVLPAVLIGLYRVVLS